MVRKIHWTGRFPAEVVFGELGVLHLIGVHFGPRRVPLKRSQSESRMPEIGRSGSKSGERKRSDAERPKPPRLSSTLLLLVRA